ncbi:MAG: histidine triad nucleotide-binding protein [Peptostreptococcales bacterium]
MSECLFCKIINKEIPSDPVYEDDLIFAFNDINPQAPVHILIVPKKHIGSLDDVQGTDAELMGYMMLKIKDMAEKHGLTKGYRVVNNCGEDGLQSVQHVHFHLLGGRKLLWPPG